MIPIILFFIGGIVLVTCLLAPFAKRLENRQQKLQNHRKDITKTVQETPIETVVTKRRNESILEQMALQKKQEGEVLTEMEQEKLKLEEIAKTRATNRVKLQRQTCEFVLNTGNIKGKADVMDISTTGIKIRTDRDILFQPDTSMRITFTFEGKDYSFKGNPLRKTKIANATYEYGIVFVHDNKEQLKQLHRTIWEMQRKRNRSII